MPVRVQDAKGAQLEVSTKEQAQAWVAVGYRIVDETESDKSAPAKPAKKAAAKAAKK